MQDAQTENAQRWRAWRTACEDGQDWAEAYDTFLHPATRIPTERLEAARAPEEARRRAG